MSDLIEKWKLYGKMTDLGNIARRFFVMNLFDGILPVLGIIITYFIVFYDGEEISNGIIIIQGLAISCAIGISGITGGLIAEKAERTKNIIDLKKSMAIQMTDNINQYSKLRFRQFKDEDYYPIIELEKDDFSLENEYIELDPKNPVKKENITSNEKTINEKAENFAGLIASLINGFAPVIGGFICLLPFFFSIHPNIVSFILAFIISLIILFLLGVYLAKISKDKIWKYSLFMVMTGLITGFLSFFISPRN